MYGDEVLNVLMKRWLYANLNPSGADTAVFQAN